MEGSKSRQIARCNLVVLAIILVWVVGIAAPPSVATPAAGPVWAWGFNYYGELGNGSMAGGITPVQVSGPAGVGVLTGFTAVSAGAGYSLALKQDGTVWAWGDNTDGQLGDGTVAGSFTPVQVVGPGGAGFLTGVTAIAASGEHGHSLAIKQDGTVWAWGYNFYGGLGDGTTTERLTPVEVLGPGGKGFLTGVTAVSAGGYHSLALKNDGTVWAWGFDGYGDLGDGTITTERLTPVQVVGPGGAGFLTGVIAVSAAGYHSLAVTQDGTAWSWGLNESGELGDGTTTERIKPTQLVGPGGTGFLTGVTAVSAGASHGMALKQDGTVWAWGLNYSGELGDGTTVDRLTPVQVQGPGGAGFLTSVQAVSAGYISSFALKQDGTVLGWGDNGSDELGQGTNYRVQATPVQVLGLAGAGFLQSVTTISAGNGHTLAVLAPSSMTFTPAAGHVGDSVTISGSNFAGTTAVRFNGATSNFIVNSDHNITAAVPYGASSGPITLTTPAGIVTSASNFTVPAPSITTLTPDHGSLGSLVIISGTGFTGASSVTFNGSVSNFTVNSDTSISDYVPYTGTSGPITIVTPAGIGTSAASFTINAPSISGFTPIGGPVQATVTITGSAFTAASSVTFNGVVANYTINSDTRITATVPLNATTGPIKVITPAGAGASVPNFVVSAPGITGFSPSNGAIGSIVTIAGINFTGATDVQFGGVSAKFFYSSDTQINATVPPGFVSGMISVITPAGTGTTAALTPAKFTVPGPVITNLNPNNGSLRSMVVITGTGFTSATGVKFNGVSANYYINLDSQLVAFVPDTATTGPVTATTPSGTSAGVTFTVNPPVITGFNPTHGSIGCFVTISGSGFTLASGVKFGGVSASYFVSNDTSISAQVPTGFVSGTISVTGPIGTGTSAGTFTVDAPTITGFSPASGPAGTNVTVNGSGFTGATSIQFNGATASLFVANDGQISTTVPAGATTGPITVTGPGGTGTSGTNFTVQ